MGPPHGKQQLSDARGGDCFILITYMSKSPHVIMVLHTRSPGVLLSWDVVPQLGGGGHAGGSG